MYKRQAEEASAVVANMLIALRLQSHLSAKHVCTLAWWLKKAGLKGVVADLAVHPDRSSSQYSKHFDLIAGTRAVDIAEDFYVADVAIHSRTQAKRLIQPMPVFTPLDALAEEIKATPDMHANTYREYHHRSDFFVEQCLLGTIIKWTKSITCL